MTKKKNTSVPKVDSDFFPIADFKKKVKMKLNGAEFFQSPLLVFRDSDVVEVNPNDDGISILTYEGKGDVKGYAHQGGGPLSFSSATGVYLGNVTEFSII